MRLISLEIPEPGATEYQNLMRPSPKLTRSRATKSNPCHKRRRVSRKAARESGRRTTWAEISAEVEAHAQMAGYAPRSALLSFVVMFQSNYYFSSSVPCFQITDSLRDLTQSVTLVDDRCYLFGLDELMQDGQVLFVGLRE
jgi:hypothetical protein